MRSGGTLLSRITPRSSKPFCHCPPRSHAPSSELNVIVFASTPAAITTHTQPRLLRPTNFRANTCTDNHLKPRGGWTLAHVQIITSSQE
eukprot:8152290-Pyramimonas_sp.AAC.2